MLFWDFTDLLQSLLEYAVIIHLHWIWLIFSYISQLTCHSTLHSPCYWEQSQNIQINNYCNTSCIKFCPGRICGSDDEVSSTDLNRIKWCVNSRIQEITILWRRIIWYNLTRISEKPVDAILFWPDNIRIIVTHKVDNSYQTIQCHVQ